MGLNWKMKQNCSLGKKIPRTIGFLPSWFLFLKPCSVLVFMLLLFFVSLFNSLEFLFASFTSLSLFLSAISKFSQARLSWGEQAMLVKVSSAHLTAVLTSRGSQLSFCTDCSQTLGARLDFLQGQATQSLQTPQLRVSKLISHPTPTPSAPISLALLPNCPCHRSTHMKYLFS